MKILENIVRTKESFKKGLRYLAYATVMGLAFAGGSREAKAVDVNGIDVSSHDGVICWKSPTDPYKPQVVNDSRNFKFAYVRATWGDSDTDSQFKINMDNAEWAGLSAGAYHFAYPSYPKGNANYDAFKEAEYFVNIVKNGTTNYLTKDWLVPALDLEEPNSLDYWHPTSLANSKSELTIWALDWLFRVQQLTGVEPIIYTHHAFAEDYLDPTKSVLGRNITNYGVWFAHLDSTPPTINEMLHWSDWQIWQYNHHGTVQGIPNGANVDLDYAKELQFIPEPATVGLLGLGALALLGKRKTKQ